MTRKVELEERHLDVLFQGRTVRLDGEEGEEAIEIEFPTGWSP